MSKASVTTRFPFINLEKALNRAKQLYANDSKGRPMAVPTAFAAWGYSEKSSGGHQTVSALKMYGLAQDSGSNEDRRIQLSDTALQYFQEEREDQQKALEETLIQHCREILAHLKCPRSIDFHLKLPRHQTGKIYKQVLRENTPVRTQSATRQQF